MCPLNGQRHSPELPKEPGSPLEVQCRSMRPEHVARLTREGRYGAQAFLVTMRQAALAVPLSSGSHEDCHGSGSDSEGTCARVVSGLLDDGIASGQLERVKDIPLAGG